MPPTPFDWMFRFFYFFIFWEMDGKRHAGGVRRHVASICDRSFDPISILGKVIVHDFKRVFGKMILESYQNVEL